MPVLAAGFLDNVWSYLSDGSHWSGNEGIPHLFLQHLQLTLVSTVVAAVIALPIGIALGHVRRGGAAAINIANVGRALPALGILILGVEWFGISQPGGVLSPVHSVPAFVAMVALAIPPMMANAFVGVSTVDDEVREAARGMGMSPRQVLWRAEIPIALPLIMAGVRTAVVAVVATATLAAYVDGGGLGLLISTGFAVQDNAKVFVGGASVAVLAIAVELALAGLQRVLVSQGLQLGGRRMEKEIAAHASASGVVEMG